MRLTSFTDYGLRMMMRMAGAPGRSFSTAELADEFGLSRNHLTKIMQRLGQGGIVTTRRGGGGGASLARDPQAITVGAIVRLLEEGQPMVECFTATGGDCTLTGCCLLKARLRSAEAAFMADLDRSTLAEIALPAGPILQATAGTEV
ncbi:MAG: RrF2 family transcriptional regulator [Gemmobacter sp.]